MKKYLLLVLCLMLCACQSSNKMEDVKKELIDKRKLDISILTEQYPSQPTYKSVYLCFDDQEKKVFEVFLKDKETVDHVQYTNQSINEKSYRIEYPKMTDNLSDGDVMKQVKESMDEELKNIDMSYEEIVEFMMWYAEHGYGG